MDRILPTEVRRILRQEVRFGAGHCEVLEMGCFDLITSCRRAKDRNGRPIRGTALALLFVLASYADDRGQCWPAVAILAGDLNVHPRKVREGLAHLQDAGMVTVIGQGPHGANLYQTNITVTLSGMPKTASCRKLHITPAQNGTQTAKNSQ